MLDLSGKVAVVTGGGDGIGKACCKILASAGAKVVVSNLHIEKALAVVEEIKAAGGEASAVKCDVFDDNDIVSTVNFAIDHYGALNILVNNAGMGGGGRENPFAIDKEYVKRIYDINVFAPWRFCQLAVPHMAKSGYGSIVNIASMSSVNREENMSIYSSSKAALVHMSANLAFDFGPYGVRINCVAPGAVHTNALASILTPEIEAQMLRQTPVKRLGEVSDIAQAVLFLASPMSGWISGQSLLVNGGGIQKIDG